MYGHVLMQQYWGTQNGRGPVGRGRCIVTHVELDNYDKLLVSAVVVAFTALEGIQDLPPADPDRFGFCVSPHSNLHEGLPHRMGRA